MARFFFPSFRLWIPKTVQRSALCSSRRELSNAYFLANVAFDTTDNEVIEFCAGDYVFLLVFSFGSLSKTLPRLFLMSRSTIPAGQNLLPSSCSCGSVVSGWEPREVGRHDKTHASRHIELEPRRSSKLNLKKIRVYVSHEVSNW